MHKKKSFACFFVFNIFDMELIEAAASDRRWRALKRPKEIFLDGWWAVVFFGVCVRCLFVYTLSHHDDNNN
jgi:hypothetical protein